LQGAGGGTGGISIPTPFSMAANARGFQLYVGAGTINAAGNFISAQGYDGNANPIQPFGERTDYSGGGAAIDPHAAAVSGKIYILWDKARLSGSTIMETRFGPSRPPDLLTHLGLNVGNPWVDAGLVLGGSIGAGVAIGLANVAIVILLLLVWGAISLVVPHRLRWLAYAIAIGLVLVWLFNPAASPPWFVFVIHDLRWPGGWIAALGGTFVAIWSGLFLFRRFESVFRAVSIAFAAVFFVAAMYAVTLIQTEITQI